MTVIVLGMHRSGTSCLTGMLEEAGVTLGEVSRANPYNLKGNCENMRIMRLHDDLLSANDGSWDNPPKAVVWQDKHRKERNRIIDDYKAHSFWGFKDPRTLFALEGWLEVLPDSRCIGTFRDPRLVASSLNIRNGFPLEKGQELWYQYNKRLYDYYLQFGFPIISFDSEKDEYVDNIVRVLKDLGLGRPSGDFSFFDNRLRSAKAEKEFELPLYISELYENLRQCSI